MAHEEGSLHSFAAILGNDVAIKAYRDRKLPFPDGTIIAALHYSHVPSEENNKVFGDPQSFVPGPPTNVQFMVKESKKYATTGGWGFAHFDKDGKPGTEAALKALPATPKLLATPSSPNTHPDTNNRTERLHLERIVARQFQPNVPLFAISNSTLASRQPPHA